MTHTEFTDLIEHRTRGVRCHQRQGVILVVVAIMLIMISLTIYGFVGLMQIENRASQIRGQELRLENAVASGAEYLLALLKSSREQRFNAVSSQDETARFGWQPLLSETDSATPVFFSVVTRNTDRSRQSWQYGVTNETSKIHLEMLMKWERQQPGAGQDALLGLPGMTLELADAILDWLDEDSIPRAQGAEQDFYSTLDPPYLIRNGIPPRLEELQWVNSQSNAHFFGNVDSERNETKRRTTPGKTERNDKVSLVDSAVRWHEMLTVHSRERNESYEGTARIDLNQQNLAQLHQELMEQTDQQWADFIILYRQYGPYRGSKSGSGRRVSIDLSKPGSYRVASEFDLIGAKISVTSGDRRRAIARSPIGDDPHEWPDQLARFIDKITVDAKPILSGRINVNQAPREVLLAVPQIDETLADRIVAARKSPGIGDSRLRHPAWLMEEGLIDRKTMKRLAPYLTTGGDVVSANIIGHSDDSPLVVRVETAIDGTDTKNPQLYYKDLRDDWRSFPFELFQRGETELRRRSQRESW